MAGFSPSSWILSNSTVKKVASGIQSITVTQKSDGVYLTITFSSGVKNETKIDGILTTQQRNDLVKAIPILNKMIEDSNGKLNYDGKRLLNVDDISEVTIELLKKLLNTITIDTHGKTMVNGVKTDIDSDNDITLNGNKVVFKTDLDSKQDKLVQGNNITIDTNNKISSNQIDDSLITSDKKTYSIDKILDLLKTKQKKIYFNQPSMSDILEDNDIWIENNNGKLILKVYDLADTKWNELSGNSNFKLKIWTSGENYLTNEYVVYDYKLYQVNQDINGDTTFDESKYDLIIGGSNVKDIPLWKSGKDYLINDEVKYNNNIYQCIKAHTSFVFEDETDNWIKIIDDYVVLTQKQQDYIIKNNLIEDKLYVVTDVSDEDSSGGSTSGTNDYVDLINKPSINNIELVGNKKLSDLGIDTLEDEFKDYVTNTEYKKGKYVFNNNILYKVSQDFTSTDIVTDTLNGNLVKYVGGTDYDDTTIKKNISDINKAIGDINGLTIVGAKDLVSAVNKLDLSFMQSFVYNIKDGKKLLTIIYKNGNTTDIDLSAIITSTNIGELANVDDTGITDKQLLGYDSSTGKYIPITIDNSNILQEAKDYTDKQINTINHVEGKVVDSKPTIVNNGDGTYSIIYIKDGTSTTTTDTNIWFFYNTGTNTYAQTIFIDGVEITLSMNGSIDLTDYVNKTTDLASGFTGSEIDKTKVTTIKELDDLLAIINTSLDKKVNTSDIINDLAHEDINKPLSAKQGKELKKLIDDISISVTGGGSVVLKKLFENVTANTVNKFDSPLPLDNACMINVYKIQEGSTNLNEVLEEFKNNTKQDFIKNEDEISIDDNGGKIKDKYEILSTSKDGINVVLLNFANIYKIEYEEVE